VLLAGPGIQFVLLGLVILAILYLPDRLPANVQQPVKAALAMLSLINLWWPILNLFPIWPLDGGQVCREVLTAFLGQRGVVASLWISFLVSGFIAVQILFNNLQPGRELIPHVSPYFGKAMWNAVFFALFAVNSFQALQVERNRHRWDDELPWER
jgi:Zn-dependent protease